MMRVAVSRESRRLLCAALTCPASHDDMTIAEASLPMNSCRDPPASGLTGVRLRCRQPNRIDERSSAISKMYSG